MTEHVDLLVLGSGEGGKFIAWHMAGLGQRVAVVERELIMGMGRFIASKTIEVSLNAGGTRTLTGDRVVIDAILAQPTMAEGLTALFFKPPAG